jgi:6-phospho 3-hexuloisomerase
MKYETWTTLIQEGIENTIKSTDPLEISGFAKRIQSAKRIFLMGRGRTGLVVEMFAMRLTQLGLPVFVVSHPTTPALEKTDLLILVSGSGETEPILSAASKADKIGAEIFVVTQHEGSSLGILVQDPLIIPSPSKNTKVLNGTLFEMALLLSLDAVVVELLNLTGQRFEDMSKRHTNIG